MNTKERNQAVVTNVEKAAKELEVESYDTLVLVMSNNKDTVLGITGDSPSVCSALVEAISRNRWLIPTILVALKVVMDHNEEKEEEGGEQ